MAFIAGGLNMNGCNGEMPCNCYPISDTTTECVTDRGHRYINDGSYDSVQQNEEAFDMMQIDIDSAPMSPGVSIFHDGLAVIADLASEAVRIAEDLLEGTGRLLVAAFAPIEGPGLSILRLSLRNYFDMDLKPSYFGGPVYSPVISILDECEAGRISGCDVVIDPTSTFEGAWKALEDIF